MKLLIRRALVSGGVPAVLELVGVCCNDGKTYPTIKRLKKKFFFSHKIHASTLEAGFEGSVMERQITFKPFPGSSRNGQHDIYFHVRPLFGDY